MDMFISDTSCFFPLLKGVLPMKNAVKNVIGIDVGDAT